MPDVLQTGCVKVNHLINVNQQFLVRQNKTVKEEEKKNKTSEMVQQLRTIFMFTKRIE